MPDLPFNFRKGIAFDPQVVWGGNLQVIFIVSGYSGVERFAQNCLERVGFAVRLLCAQDEVVDRAERVRPALIILDSLGFDGNGLELCRRIRATPSLSRTPVIFLAAQASEEQRTIGLESGADDYISGELSGLEFVTRVRAVIRRFTRDFPSQSPATLGLPPFSPNAPIKVGDIELDTSGMRVLIRGGEIEITILEFRLMYYLTHYRSRVFTRDQLLDAVWGSHSLNPRCVDACVRRLRRKIEPNVARPIYLKTIRGAGYCFASV